MDLCALFAERQDPAMTGDMLLLLVRILLQTEILCPGAENRCICIVQVHSISTLYRCKA